MIGITLGHYRIVDKIGVGGMGVVYRARDERLDRDVAIKVLPEKVAEDADRLARFEREAKLLASLNHSNIATLHGLEEEGGQRFLVMELVEGESLASFISRGRIPVDEALPIALQIANALEAAHENGIIHRDLKPHNVMVDTEGQVKVLDFGLAKVWHDDISEVDLTHSPTLTAQRTADGVILGTAAYMSPEQARGKVVDKRADIWAFGCTLYEMLTSRRAFAGDTATDILAAIITSEPDWDELPQETPRHIHRLLRRCLTKDPRDRLHDFADVRIELSDSEAIEPESPVGSRGTSRKWLRILPWVLVPIVALGGWVVSRIPKDQIDKRAYRSFEVGMPKGERFLGLPQRALALSPDGRTLAFSSGPVDFAGGESPGYPPINLRMLDSWENQPISGTEGGVQPVFSPDGRWLLFVTGSDTDRSDGEPDPTGSGDLDFWRARYLNKISLERGSPIQLCECDASSGATWGFDGTIVFAGLYGPLFQIPDAGGEPQPATTLDHEAGEISHRLPHFLPNGKTVVYTAVFNTFDWSTAKVFVHNLETGERSLVIEGGADAQYVSSGHLVFARDDRLMAVPFDLERLEVTGHAVSVLEGVSRSIDTPMDLTEVGAAQVALSDTGVLAFAPGSTYPRNVTTLVAFDREGRKEALSAEALTYLSVRAVGDGRVLLMWVKGRETDIWSFDRQRKSMRRQTFEGGSFPIWGPGPGQFTYSMKGFNGIAVKELDTDTDSGQILPIEIPKAVSLVPSSWSHDARHLVFCSNDPVTLQDIWVYSLEEGVYPFLKTEFEEAWAEFSPNGRWIAYASNMSGAFEIYLRPFPGSGSAIQVSTNGGFEPAWSKNGDELFFSTVNLEELSTGEAIKIFSASIEEENGSLRVGTPKRLFVVDGSTSIVAPIRGYDVLDDGRFVYVDTSGAPSDLIDEFLPDRIRIVENWFAELERLAPTGKQ